MAPALPVEMIGYILDYLHSDHPTLLACCLISSSWRRCAQPEIFRSVDITKERVASLLPAALAVAPHLAAHIRAVCIPILFDDSIYVYSPVKHGSRSFLTHGPFRCVTNLTFSVPDGEHPPSLDDNDFPAALLGAAFPGVRALTIDTAQFSDLAALTCLLSTFPDVTYLCLRHLEIRYTADSVVDARMPPLALTTLILDDCDPDLNTLSMADGALLPHPPPLRNLVVRNYRQIFDAKHVADLAARAVDTLAELAIETHYLQDLEAFARNYTASHGALRFLRVRLGRTDARADLAHAVRLAREIAPGEDTRIALAMVDWMRQDEWSAVRDAPLVWTCANVSAGCVYDGREALEMLGITLPGVS